MISKAVYCPRCGADSGEACRFGGYRVCSERIELYANNAGRPIGKQRAVALPADAWKRPVNQDEQAVSCPGGSRKMDTAKLARIRKASGTNREIAERFGLSVSTIQRARSGKSYVSSKRLTLDQVREIRSGRLTLDELAAKYPSLDRRTIARCKNYRSYKDVA